MCSKTSYFFRCEKFIHSKMLMVFTSLTYYEITLVSLHYFQARVLKSCIVSVKTDFSKRQNWDLFYLFIMDCKNLFSFSRAEESFWEVLCKIEITDLQSENWLQNNKVSLSQDRRDSTISIWEKKRLLNTLLTFCLHIVDVAINSFSLSLTNEVLLDNGALYLSFSM